VREDAARALQRGAQVAEDCARHGVRVLFRGESPWPQTFECLSDEPEVLFVRGRVGALAERAVAIVGSREGTPEGRDLAFRLAFRLAEEGWASVSGLARGVDTAAHRGTLSAGGETIAVLGCGPDIPYPEENRDLFERIAEEGLLVSEFAPGMPPISGNFPRRNRLLAAIASAVVLVECRRRSGALVTCRHALEQGREIFVVPGWPGHPLAAGPLQLLRDGARLIRDADDLLEDLGGIPGGVREVGDAADGALASEPFGETSARDAAALAELLGDRADRRGHAGA
jgi:DNA processing protein